MTIEAVVENGQIVLPDALALPDGTKVSVSIEKQSTPECVPSGQTINQRLKNVIGKATGLPADFAENHDHYIHGAAKKASP